MLIYLGIEDLFDLKNSGEEYQKFTSFFIYPSIGFGFVIFPKISAELIFNAFSYTTERFQYQLSAFVGWLLVAYLGCVLVF